MRELPTGAVTFLFTDIEGSTQLVRQLRGRWPEVLAEHQRLLREAFAAHGGYEIDTQGDAFFYAFGSAHEAVLGAVEAQRALSGYPWPDTTPVKVRIGVHTGQASPVDGRYTGLAVHRAARIQAAAHGGQVLVSQSTQSLLEDEEEDLQVNLRDLGDQRLKDIDRPVRVYQVAAPGLEEQFPPLRQEAEPAAVSEPVPLYRRPIVLAAAALVLVAVVAAVVVLVTRSGGGGLSGVQANHVGIIDPASGDIVGEVEVGAGPGPVAFGDGTVWVGNQDEETLTPIDAETREPGRLVTLENRTPTGIVVDRTGVWVANGEWPGGSLQRVDPDFGRVTSTIEDADAGEVTLGDGALWAVLNSTLAKINRAAERPSGKTFAGSWPERDRLRGGGALGLEQRRVDRRSLQPVDLQEWPGSRPTTSGNSRARSPSARMPSGWRTRGATASHESIPQATGVENYPVGRNPGAICGRRGLRLGGERRRRHDLEVRPGDERGRGHDQDGQLTGGGHGRRWLRLGHRAEAGAPLALQAHGDEVERGSQD